MKMYFPYVRGRQYELLALRELIANNILSDKIIPIVEPVKLSSTLIKTIDEYVAKNKKIGIVCNPKVGDFSKDMMMDRNNLQTRKNFLNFLIAKTYILFIL